MEENKEEEIQAEEKKSVVETFNDSLVELDKKLNYVLKKNLSRIASLDERLERYVRNLDNKVDIMAKILNTTQKALEIQSSKFNGIEDTFFTLYHNIKKNQFLFAKEPEEWWNDYLDLKKFYMKQNKEEKII